MSLFKKPAAPVVVKAPKTVASITAGLTDTLAELEAHADEQTTQAEAQRQMAEYALAAADKHAAESELAVKVAGNIKALLGA
ncbi:hypothetical protein SEA_DUNCANSLEG_51 [Mycobacterium phage DuncansLeg]|nr:hypothetical protein SEA_DUNCANSLEG_51 [Mycobacterium phage DuncansLeg]